MKIKYLTSKLLLLIALLLPFNSFAQPLNISNTQIGTPASPYPTTVTQADGTSLTVFVKGNATVNYLETEDGYTILKDNDNYYKYAIDGSQGDLVASNIKAHNLANRSLGELAFLNNTAKHKRYTGATLQSKQTISPQLSNTPTGNTPMNSFPSTGTRNALLILIDFPDMNNTYSTSNMNDMCNQVGYSVNGQSGSFRDYYIDVSDNQLTINTTVDGWYTANNNRSTYGDANGSTAARNLVREAIDAAELAGMDFSQFDGDNDGAVDVVMVIHAGRGAEESGDSDDIWSHRWSLGSQQVTYDGVLISDYIIQPETYTSSNGIANIGVLCHEFGHALGLPDLYDTNGGSEGIGRWCLMAGGSWNNNGKTPGEMSAWCKQELGWITPTVLTGSGTISNMNHASGTNADYYRMNTTSSNEYFLIENRQQTGWDTHLPGEGLAIWHIDENQSTNTNESHKKVDLEAADGNNDMDNEINRGDNGDLYPGSSNNTILNGTSNPNSNSYSGAATNISVTNISESGNYVSFNYGSSGGGSGGCSSTVNSTTYSEGFENMLGAWTQSSNDDIDWTNNTGGTTSSTTGPTAASEGSYYMYIEATNHFNETAILESPCFDLSAFSSNVTPKVIFDYNMYGASMGTLTLEVSTNNGSSWSSLWSKTGNQGIGWHPISICLDSYSGQTIQLRFVGTTGSSYTSDMAIDRFQVTAAPATLTAPSLNTPTNFATNVSTSGGITFNWSHTFGSSVDAARIQVSKVSSNSTNNFIEDAWACGTQNSSNANLPVNTSLVTLTNGQGSFIWNTASISDGIFEAPLPNTTYYWTVRYSISNGSNAGHSYYTASYQFTTNSTGGSYCSVPTTPITLPFTEGFENINGVYTDGSIYCGNSYIFDLITTDPSVCRASVGTDAEAFSTGNGAITLDRNPSGVAETNWLFLTVNLSNYSTSNNLELSFDFAQHGEEQHPNDKVFIRGSNTSTWIQVYDWYSNKLSNGLFKTVSGIDIDSVLTANNQFPTSTFQVAFGQEDTHSAPTDGLTIDNISITNSTSSSCLAPVAVTATNISANSATVNWTSTASNFNIEYGASGFVQGNGTLTTSSSASKNLTSLAPQTTYDVYIQADCGSNQSAWVGPLSFTTNGLGGGIIVGTGTGTNTTTGSSPVNIYYRSLRYQTLYTAAELTAAGATAGDINALGWNVSSAPLYDLPNYKISIKHTTATDVSAHDGSGLVQVFLDTMYAPVAGGFDMLNFQTPFSWNGIDNILIDVCFDQVNPSWNSSGQVVVFSSSSGARYIRSDNSSQCGNSTSSTLNEKPQVKFVIGTTSCGTVAGTTLPFFEGFENNNGTFTNNENIICTPTYKWDFETTDTSNGRVRIGTDAYTLNSGNGAATLDGILPGITQTNSFVLTLDLSSYSTSNTLNLGFDFQDHGDEPDIEDRVWIRGNQTDTWLEIYDWSTLNASGFTSVTGLDIDALLSSNGQTASNTFQVKFGQKDNYYAPTDGLTIDNISITNTITSCTDNYEPNNTYLTATYGGSGFSDTTLCLTTGDEDWFSISTGGNTYYLKVSGATSSVFGEYGLSFSNWNSSILGIQTMSVNGSTTDTYLTLYDTDGTTILASDDNGGNGNFSSIAYTFNCSGQADIGIQAGAFNVLSINGTTITGSLRVLNGGTASTGAFVASFYASSDFTITTSDYKLLDYNVPSLAPNSTHTINFTVDASTLSPAIPTGTYYIGDILDNYNTVLECIETNNNGAWLNPTLNITNTSVCNTPTSLISSPTAISANLQWGAVTGGNSYDIDWRILGTTSWTQVSTTGTSALLSGLNSGTTYQWRVRTDCGSTTSAWSSIQNFTTSTIHYLTLNPTSLNPTSSAGNSTITVTSNIVWTASKTASWLTLNNGSGSNNGSFTISYTTNASPNSRTATVTVSGSGVSNKTITVIQAGSSVTPPFTWNPTNQSGVFLGQAQVAGIPAGSNDWIAAFDQNGNCAGAGQIVVNGGVGYINFPIYGNDPTTPNIDEGMDIGEYFSLQLYDASTSTYRDYPTSANKYQFTQWSHTNGTPMPPYSNPNTVYNFLDYTADTINFVPGWNLISLDVIPSDSSIISVLSSLLAQNNLLYVTGFNNGTTLYNPNGLPFLNTLSHFTRGYGYWVKVNNAATVIIQGNPLGSSYKPALNAGWNLVAYPPYSTTAPATYYSNLMSTNNLLYVTGFDNGTKLYDPNGLPFLNTLNLLENGFGYWVKVNTSVGGNAYRGNGFTPTNIYDFFNGSSNLEGYEGEEVTILTEEGEVCGKLQILNGGYLMTTSVYGDDLTSPNVEGIDIGDKLLFEFRGQVLDPSIFFGGNMQLHLLDLQFNISMLTTSDIVKIENVKFVCLPNPFSNVLNIEFELEKPAKTIVRIVNSLGQEVKVFDENYHSGINKIAWYPNNQVADFYFILLEIDGQVILSKKVLMIN